MALDWQKGDTPSFKPSPGDDPPTIEGAPIY
jgi:hypothetical protein